MPMGYEAYGYSYHQSYIEDPVLLGFPVVKAVSKTLTLDTKHVETASG